MAREITITPLDLIIRHFPDARLAKELPTYQNCLDYPGYDVAFPERTDFFAFLRDSVLGISFQRGRRAREAWSLNHTVECRRELRLIRVQQQMWCASVISNIKKVALPQKLWVDFDKNGRIRSVRSAGPVSLNWMHWLQT